MDKRLLIADDSEELRLFLQEHFRTLGYGIRTATNGEEVLRMLDEEAPDLLILDVMMPNPNGFQICRRVKADPRFAGLPVVMLTARSQPEDVYWGKDCGADAYVIKPFKPSDLEFQVGKLLASRTGQGRRLLTPLRWVEMKKELQARDDDREMAHCTLKWNDRAASVFRKKYGEVQFGEAMEKVFEILRVLFEGEEVSAGIEFQAGRGIQLLMPTDRRRSEELTRKITFHLNHLLRSFYSREDLERDGVVYKKYGSKRESRVPLLEFTPTLSFYSGC